MSQRKKRQSKRSFLGHLRTYFFTGLILTAPFTITVYLIILIVEAVDGWFRPLIPSQYDPNQWLPYEIPGLGVIIAILLLTIIGAVAANLLGQVLVRTTEAIIRRLPVIGTVYGGLKQILEAAFSESSESFSKVVLLEYPRKGIWALAFVTNPVAGGAVYDSLPQSKDKGGGYYAVFLPTTPNPTSGFFLIVPESEAIVLPIKVEDAAKMIISAGMVNETQVAPQP